MALKGNLRDFSTTQLLNLINLARKTGTLTIQHDGDSAQLSFREGKLIYAFMGQDTENHLAQILHDAGKLSEEQARIIQLRAKGTSDKQLGHMLIQRGHITQSDIIQSVRQSVLDTVYRLFTWGEGLFRFDANTLPSPGHITIPIDLESVIMEGSRRLKEWEILQEELPDLDISLRFTDHPDARLRNINLTVEEWRVVSFVNPRNSIHQIARANNLSDFEIRRIVYGMLQAGLVEIVRPAKPQPIPPVPGKSPSAKQETRKEIEQQSPAVKRSVVVRLIDRIRGL
ncbi:MAG: DUF4388 domain-containing protein [Chloroflexi bacterium]|nr:DUF4388 domain-containing protein [Chloroflexota bacterium]MBK6711702.1 DUF4388 domain-containing protein [Chloroflexota bacterium]MBK7177084.1 DUF4388 domain-containing protein [Chloroflexota bacterium]MBK8931525.1 DUF4388 domain-containing protein [Chloroflexota bacterium]MBP6803133.1 DUF4388 domain-containing protein [Chloroflexota bacterium]